ncbi:MAG: hypothetical protein M1831_002999 [Alyxoria varia]|nr:MAG: hypothetical protein M1831_002999 [Alyxoria varia]
MSPHAIADSALPQLKISLSYSPEDSEQTARSLIFALYPEWKTSPGSVEFVRFKDGITNTLFKALKRRPGYNDHQIDQEAVLLRAYGTGTDILIDREREAVSHSLLAKHQLASPLLARFNNGLLYKFIEGTPCTPADLRRPDVWPATARHLGRWHGILPVGAAIASVSDEERKWTNINEIIPYKPIPNIWTIMLKWIAALPNDTKEERERNLQLNQEVERSTRDLGHTPGLDEGRYILAHCDLLSANVIVHPRTEKKPGDDSDVSFIDYEYTTPAPVAFDLANHFAEWVGLECNYNLLPARSQRRAFVEQYVKSYRSHQHQTEITSEQLINRDVDSLMREIDKFRGMPGLFWGIWALIQAMISSIDFDYKTYASNRLGEYWAWRTNETEIDGKSAQELPLRERRWAQE